MAAIDYTFVEQNTNQSLTSATPGDISGAAIASGNFTAGKKYFLLNTYLVNENSSGQLTIGTVHGSTTFPESIQTIQIRSTNAFRYPTGWFTVWTAVSSEGIKLQHSASTGTVNTDNISMLKINLSDDVTENTDWFFNERPNDDALSTTPVDGASITVPTAGTWLVLSYCLVQITSATADRSFTSSIVRSGEASSSEPSCIVGETTTSAIIPVILGRVFTTTASNTFKEQCVATATNHTRLHSSIFAINLDKFAQVSQAYTSGSTALSNTSYATTMQTTSITPASSTPVWVLGSWIFDQNNQTSNNLARIQIDGTDAPTDWTSDGYNFAVGTGANGLQELPFVFSTVQTLSAASHTINLHGSTNNATNSPATKMRSLVAVAMELVSTGYSKFQGKFFGKFGGKL